MGRHRLCPCRPAGAGSGSIGERALPCRYLSPRGHLEWAQVAGRGYASIALNAAIQTLKDEGATDFGLLFCEPRNAPFYTGRGWKPFEGEIYADQPEGRVRFETIAPYVYHLKRMPPRGIIDLCGLPW
jgi:hypothetical protein